MPKYYKDLYKSNECLASKTQLNQAFANMKSLILLVVSVALASGQTDCPTEDYVQGKISGICYRFTDVGTKVGTFSCTKLYEGMENNLGLTDRFQFLLAWRIN